MYLGPIGGWRWGRSGTRRPLGLGNRIKEAKVAKKKGNGEGSITRRKDGLYMARYWVETPRGPKRMTIYHKKREEVAKKLADALSARNKGLSFDDENTTVGEYIARWLEDSAKGNLAPRTYSNYHLQVRRHITQPWDE